MTDITELAQSLKAAAEGVIKNYDCEWFETGRQICTVHKSKINLIGLASPANVLALVEALEKAQRVDESFASSCLSALSIWTLQTEVMSRRLKECVEWWLITASASPSWSPAP